MDRIWAPWRKAYIRPDKKKDRACIFCRLLASKNDSRDYILKRTPHNYAVLNLYPYNNGHILIVPNRHIAGTEKMADEEKLDWLALYEEMLAALKKSIKPHGFNSGINMGRLGGAGVPGHLHLHLVPRWKGDANFMPVLTNTRVISESLNSVYKLLKRNIKE